MESDTNSKQTPSCPGENALVALHRGLLPESELVGMGAHLEACLLCCYALKEIQSWPAQDRLSLQLHRCLAVPAGYSEPGYQRLEKAAEALAHSDATTRPVSSSSPSPTQGLIGQSIGAYLIREQVGRGGMGVVYQAQKVGEEELVALKVLQAGTYADRDARRRFRTEGSAIARVQHPNVVRFLAFGESAGQPYCVMEWVGGGTLANKLLQSPLPARQSALLLKTLALAVAHAHAQNVIHRDLKPGNILLSEEGQAKISDFGLAKLLDQDHDGLTQTGMVLGTPAYMAPEQAAGRGHEVGPACDIYALGAILYECLCGQVPFKGVSRTDTIRMVCEEQPQPPSRRRAGVPALLEAICLKCLEKDPSKRYPSAEVLADDLERWLRGERPRQVPGLLSRWRRAGQRNWKWVAAALVVVLGLLGGLVALEGRDPDRALRQLEAELKEGQSVTLIGEGRPKWCRWQMGERNGHTSLGQDNAFMVQTWSYGLLELLPDPQWDSYRFSAQVRHLQSNGPGEVGLYVCRKSYPDGNRDEWSLLFPLTFNEVRAFEMSPQYQKNKEQPVLNPVRLSTLFCSSGNSSLQSVWRMASADGPRLRALGENKGLWHDVAITVTPSVVVGEWDGVPFRLRVHDSQLDLEQCIARRRLELRDDSFMQNLAPRVTPGGGLGLLVSRGVASFRQVKIQPMINPQ